MVINHTLGIAGRTGGIVEGDGVPLVTRQRPLEIWIPGSQELLILQPTKAAAPGPLGIIDIDHRQISSKQAEGLLDGSMVLRVGNQHLRIPMLQDEGDSLRIQPYVQRVQDAA